MPRVKIGPALPDREKIDVEIARLRDLDVGQLSGEHFTGDEVAEYVRVGRLMRGGKGNKWLYITQAGQDAHDDYHHYDKAAA